VGAGPDRSGPGAASRSPRRTRRVAWERNPCTVRVSLPSPLSGGVLSGGVAPVRRAARGSAPSANGFAPASGAP